MVKTPMVDSGLGRRREGWIGEAQGKGYSHVTMVEVYTAFMFWESELAVYTTDNSDAANNNTF